MATHRTSGSFPSDFAARVHDVVADVEAGTVVTYGEVAVEAGAPGAARAVGTVLSRSEGLPWWRVVAANGRLAPGKEDEQARLLDADGVRTRDGRVVGMSRRRAGS